MQKKQKISHFWNWKPLIFDILAQTVAEKNCFSELIIAFVFR